MNKQVVILAAGESSRFYPFARESHKAMHVVCGKPLVGWTLEGLREIGVREVIIVVSTKDKEIQQFLASVKTPKVKVVFQKEPLGMGDALLASKKYLEEEFVVGFSHFVNPKVFEEVISGKKTNLPFAVLADKTDEPWKYGILSLEGRKAKGIVEKPPKGKEPSDIRAAGAYLLGREFLKTLETTEPSHYNFEIALDELMKEGKVEVVTSSKAVFSLKYAWDLFEISRYLLEKIQVKKAKNVFISPKATVEGKVIIEEGAKIFDHATVKGPVYIGKAAVVGAYSTLRDNSVLEEGAELQRYADMTRSLFGAGSQIHSGFIGDSVIGKNVRMGANFITANRRVDRGEIEVGVKGDKTSSGSTYLGVLMGDSVKTGINVSTMPGVVIGKEVQIGPATVVMESVEEKTLIYSDHKKSTVIKKIK